MYIARSVNIPCVDIDFAKYKNRKGVISKTFNLDKEEEITLYEILKKYFDEVILKNYDLFDIEDHIGVINNLETIWWAMDYFYKERQDKGVVVSSLMKDIVDAFILQIFIGNTDLHSKNVVILGSEHPHLALNYDFEEGNQVHLKSNYGSYAMQVFSLHYNDSRAPMTTISSFLASSSLEFQEYFYEKLRKLPTFEELISFVTNHIETSISQKEYKFLEKCYTANYNVLHECFLNSQKR